MEKNETIVLGGGCFWCMEAIFQKIDGIVEVIPGYAGGELIDPTYEDVCTGNTGHAEVVRIGFRSEKISLRKVLEVFFLAHDPTTLNRQGSDIGTQYRSVILYTSDEQREVIEGVIGDVQKEYKKEIVTQVLPLEKFYKAEGYHKDYYINNLNSGYCRFVIGPKLKKVLGKEV